jgi:hypothetical protein
MDKILLECAALITCGQADMTKSALIWDITQRRSVNIRRFGATYRPHLQRPRNQIVLKLRQGLTTPRSEIFKKSADLIYTAEEA